MQHDTKTFHWQCLIMYDFILISFDKATVSLEFQELMADLYVTTLDKDAMEFWLNIKNMKSAMSNYKYVKLATLAYLFLRAMLIVKGFLVSEENQNGFSI